MKYKKIVFKLQPQNTWIRNFSFQIYTFLCFPEVLQIEKFESADFKFDNSVFKVLAQKYLYNLFWVKDTQKWYFWPQILTFLFLCKILSLQKFKGIDLKYDKVFLKFYPKKSQITHFCSRTYIFFCSHNFTIRQIWGWRFKNLTIAFLKF